MAKEESREKFAEDLLKRFRQHPGELFAVVENRRCPEEFYGTETGIFLGVIPKERDSIFWMDLQAEPLVDLIINVPKYVHCPVDGKPGIIEKQVKVFDAHSRYEKEIATRNRGDKLIQISPDRPPLALIILVGNEGVSKLDPQILEPAAKLLRTKLPLPA